VYKYVIRFSLGTFPEHSILDIFTLSLFRLWKEHIACVFVYNYDVIIDIHDSTCLKIKYSPFANIHIFVIVDQLLYNVIMN